MEIFKNKNIGWGLRGDPEFWDDLSKRFEHFDTSENGIGFNEKLELEFNDLVLKGKRISDKIVWFENYNPAGMSGGAVSLEWWINTGLPLLKDRFARPYKS